MKKFVLEGVAKFEREDGGMARIAEISDEKSALFVRIQSWHEDKVPSHPEADKLEGKRVRVTIEIVD